WDEIPELPEKLRKSIYDKREERIIKKEKEDNFKIGDEGILELLNILDNKRKEDFKDWSLVGLSLKNTNSDLLGVFNDWSKESIKYKGFSDIKKYWDNFKNKEGGLTVGSIRYWAKLDRPTLYSKWYNKYYPVEFIEDEEEDNSNNNNN
ncbi:MAG: PriCT-2 domain-containing protein, partial [Fusobacterium sp.]